MTAALDGKRILLGVTGSIAAYKAAEVVRLLSKSGALVQTVMTASAQRFLGAATLQAVSGRPVHTDLWASEGNGMEHISLARWADRVLIAPASADFLAKAAHGLADDLLTTLCLVCNTPLLLAPAMNASMWHHAATQANVAKLRDRGAQFFGPETGVQACGDDGFGRLLEPATLVEALAATFTPTTLAGVHVVVTAGPTRELLDPVRVLTNLSSGKMGYAVAAAAREAGARVTLISGPTALPCPVGVEIHRVTSAHEMRTAAHAALPADIFIGAAAVADYRPTAPAAEKIKKTGTTWTLELCRNPDILAEIACSLPRPYMVGFAAETSHLAENARRKLETKGLDLVAANLVGNPDYGLEHDDNALLLLDHHGEMALAKSPKTVIARRLIAEIARRYRLASAGG